ncbi:molybdopterin-dependent oxidoreductase, partial [Chloroflexota bacterium]
KQELYDKEFVENWTSGFERLKERVKQSPPEKVAEISWVPKNKIIEAAKLYATSKPAAIQWGVAVDQSTIAASNILAITSLWGITGNLDVPGGNIINVSCETPEIPPLDWGIEDISEETKQKRIGIKEYPWLLMDHPDMAIEQMITEKPYPLKMLWLQGTNPIACTGSDPKKLYTAMRKLDFVVVLELFMTPSAMAFADIVLPATTGLERNSIRNEIGNGSSWWGPSRTINKIVQVGECKSDEEIVLELGKRLNPQGFPWESVQEMLDSLLQKSGMTFKELREQGAGEYRPFQYKKYEKGLLRPDRKPGFDTLTGKFMFYVPAFEAAGLDPLPYYEEPLESPSTLELAKEYPLVLTTGARTWGFFHSEHRQIPEMRELNPVPVMEIHPATAQPLGIRNGDWVWIENSHGRCKQMAKLTPTIDPRVVHAQHGWWFPEKPGPEPSLFGVWESNPNLLTPWGAVGPSGYGAPLKNQICKVYKVKEESDA